MNTQQGIGPGGAAGGWVEPRPAKRVNGALAERSEGQGLGKYHQDRLAYESNRAEAWMAVAHEKAADSLREKARADSYRAKLIAATVTAIISTLAAASGWFRVLWPVSKPAAPPARPPQQPAKKL